MPVSARVAANEFINLADRRGRRLTPMQLIKLVYIAHGWSLGLDGQALIRENVEAWRYGPVIPDLYQQLKHFGGASVPGQVAASFFARDTTALTERERELIEQTYDGYGDLNGIQLSEMTHREGTPWFQTWHSQGKSAVIAQDLIAEHYRQLARDRGAA